MQTGVLLTMIALVWAGSGVTLIAVPLLCTGWVRRVFCQPVQRFLLTQGAILFGLILLLGTSGHQAHWLWVTIGGIGILKGMFFLGAPEKLRDPALNWWCHLPHWIHRASGVLTVGLAALLIIDTVRGLS